VLNAPDVEIAPHPAMRYAAFGRLARKLLENMAADDPMGIGSPVDRLTALGGTILVAGADPWLVTAAHLAEYRARPRGRMRATRHYKTIEDGAAKLQTLHMIDDGNAESRHERTFEGARARRFASAGKLGRSDATLYEAAPLVKFLAARLAGLDLFRTVLRVGGPPPEAAQTFSR
jgi:aminoglycoside N3'-acetyltransferase